MNARGAENLISSRVSNNMAKRYGRRRKIVMRPLHYYFCFGHTDGHFIFNIITKASWLPYLGTTHSRNITCQKGKRATHKKYQTTCGGRTQHGDRFLLVVATTRTSKAFKMLTRREGTANANGGGIVAHMKDVRLRRPFLFLERPYLHCYSRMVRKLFSMRRRYKVFDLPLRVRVAPDQMGFGALSILFSEENAHF